MNISEASEAIKEIIKLHGDNVLYKNLTGSITIELHCFDGKVKEYDINVKRKIKVPKK